MTMLTAERGTTERVAFAPITRIDAERREIEVTATSEALDAYGTIFDYAASRDAFRRWLGNVREMHDNVAVGRRVAVICDDAARQIRVRLRISRGAESTWQKILDGTLCGASIGATNVVWDEAQRTDAAGQEATVRVATRYDLVELSLVDNPANPDCLGIAVVRGMETDEAILDEIDGRDSKDTKRAKDAKDGEEGDTEDTEILRNDTEGLAIFEESRDAGDGDMGYGAPAGDGAAVTTTIDDEPPLHAGIKAMAQLCGCAVCAGIVGMMESPCPPTLSPAEPERGRALKIGNGMGQNDQKLVNARGDDARLMMAVARQAASGVAQVRGVVERLAREQGAAFEELRSRLARIEAQPLPGGPALRAAEKVLGAPMGSSGMNVAERIAALQEFGAAQRDQRSQVDVAAEILRLQRGFGE